MSHERQDDSRRTKSLNRLLDEMPLIEPSNSLTERIMRSVLESEAVHRHTAKHRRRRNEWINSFIAAAATLLLIQSGALSKLLTLDAEVHQLTEYIQQLSRLLQS